MHRVSDESDSSEWTYDGECDMWLTRNRRTAIQGAIVRKMTKEILRERFGDPKQSRSCDVAPPDIRRGDWIQPLTDQ